VKIYHYTKIENWKAIQEGIKTGSTKHAPGLPASSGVVSTGSEAESISAVFGLTDPAPDSWVKNNDFPKVWPFLMSATGDLLLEIDVDPLKDKSVYVIDQAHMRGGAECGPSGHSVTEPEPRYQRKYYHNSLQEAEKAYLDSKVPLQTYLEKEKQLGYSLPEVIFLEDVPLDHIHVAQNQPKLAEELEKLPQGEEKIFLFGNRRNLDRDKFLEIIRNIPGLGEHCKRYEIKAKHREDEQIKGSLATAGKSASHGAAPGTIPELSASLSEVSGELDRVLKSLGNKAVLIGSRVPVAGTVVKDYFKGSDVKCVTLSSTTDRSDLLGRYVLDSKRSHQWVNGPLTDAMEQGKPLILEGLESASGVVIKLLGVLNKYGQLPLADKGQGSDGAFEFVKSENGFKLLATFNPCGHTEKKELPSEVQTIFDVQINLDD